MRRSCPGTIPTRTCRKKRILSRPSLLVNLPLPEDFPLPSPSMSALADIEASAQRERELRKVVLSWLNKKGYTRAEEQFKREAEIPGASSAPLWTHDVRAEDGSYAKILATTHAHARARSPTQTCIYACTRAHAMACSQTRRRVNVSLPINF